MLVFGCEDLLGNELADHVLYVVFEIEGASIAFFPISCLTVLVHTLSIFQAAAGVHTRQALPVLHVVLPAQTRHLHALACLWVEPICAYEASVRVGGVRHLAVLNNNLLQAWCPY